jgi:hypothetical protein
VKSVSGCTTNRPFPNNKWLSDVDVLHMDWLSCRQVLHLKQDNARLSNEASSLQADLQAIMALAASETDTNSSSSSPSRRVTASSMAAGGRLTAARSGGLWKPSISDADGGGKGDDVAKLEGSCKEEKGAQDAEAVMLQLIMQDQDVGPCREQQQQGMESMAMGKNRISTSSLGSRNGVGGGATLQKGVGIERTRPQSAYVPAKKDLVETGMW